MAPASAATAVHARGLVLSYDGRLALAPSDLDVPAHAVTAVIGPNGSGKSTLLNAIAGLLEPVGGTLEVLGAGVPPSARLVAYVLQATSASEFLPLTVAEVVRMGRYAHRGLLGRFRSEDHEAVRAAMERLDITGLARRHLGELSGGQRQRVFVAQGLAQRAPLLLLDEPMTGLDVTTRERIGAAIAEERERGVTVVSTTHDLAEAREADHVVILAGRVVAEGPPEEVCTAPVLRRAYGTRIETAGARRVLLDDAHHTPAAGPGAASDRRGGRSPR